MTLLSLHATYMYEWNYTLIKVIVNCSTIVLLCTVMCEFALHLYVIAYSSTKV